MSEEELSATDFRECRLTWASFESCIKHIVAKAGPAVGVYGLPRGGIIMAVVLSHRMGLPLLAAPYAGALIVDDVIETGWTLSPMVGIENVKIWTWVDKTGGTSRVNSVIKSDPAAWVVFPWDDAAMAEDEAARYWKAGLRPSRRY